MVHFNKINKGKNAMKILEGFMKLYIEVLQVEIIIRAIIYLATLLKLKGGLIPIFQ